MGLGRHLREVASNTRAKNRPHRPVDQAFSSRHCCCFGATWTAAFAWAAEAARSRCMTKRRPPQRLEPFSDSRLACRLPLRCRVAVFVPSDGSSSDVEFDSIYDPKIRDLSGQHWTPVQV